jgi:hypothetical protein
MELVEKTSRRYERRQNRYTETVAANYHRALQVIPVRL